MTRTEYDAETVKIENLISVADIGKKNAKLSLAEKVAHNRERNRLQDVLVQHKLNYFELVTGESNQQSGILNPQQWSRTRA